MRDTLLKFGKVEALLKDTEYAFADIVDFGKSEHFGYLDNLNVVVQANSAMATDDTVVVRIYDGDTAATQTNLIMTGPILKLKKGEQAVLPFPKTNRRFVKVCVYAESTDTFTATEYEAWCQFGQK